MTVKLQSKRFYARGTRHKGECYGGVLDPTPGSKAIAFMRVDGERESLVYRPSPDSAEIVLADKTYILSPCFTAGYLFWVERTGRDWNMRAVKTDSPSPDAVFEPIASTGRPMSLSSWRTASGAFLTWEERMGKGTKIRLVRIDDGAIGQPADITDGNFNAYDPACCVASDGNIHIIYCAFVNGHYRIQIQTMSPDGGRVNTPNPVSNHADACVYPSIWPRQSGGVWFSYTCFDAGSRADRAFVQHHRFRSQRTFFSTQGTAYAGLFEDGHTYAVFAPPGGRGIQGNIAAMNVFGSVGAGHSSVFEDNEGRLRLLLRRHANAETPSFTEEDPPLKRSEKRGVENPPQKHPNIYIMTLLDRQWSKPECLIRHPHVEEPISFGVDGRNLGVAFTEDPRYTGWSSSAEWFDKEAEIGVGIAHVELKPIGSPKYEFHPYVIGLIPGPSIENPRINAPSSGSDGEYIHAVGQTHAHTNLSICVREKDRDPHLNYRFMQDVQHSDFGATTDHAYNMWHTEMLITRKLAEYYYFPGQFVAIPAYEWTGSIASCCGHEGGPWGHVNPLFLEEQGDLEFYTPTDPECAGGSLPRLWKTYSGKKIVTPPHHVADNIHPYNWQVFDEQFVPVIELFQDSRGSGEQPWAPGVTNFLHQETGHWAVDELKKGKRFGFIASADHTGIARAGVLTRELTRSGLYEALMARRCFATTSIALKLSFTCNGHIMGEEIEAEQAEFRLTVQAPEEIHQVQVVRNGEDVKTLPVGKEELDHIWKATRETSGEFWYCRIIFENGEIAWSSPIWLV